MRHRHLCVCVGGGGGGERGEVEGGRSGEVEGRNPPPHLDPIEVHSNGGVVRWREKWEDYLLLHVQLAGLACRCILRRLWAQLPTFALFFC